MRVLTSAALAALILSSPVLAGDRRGGGHRPPSPPPGHCGGGCRPPVTPNINVNVNANASASASASARSYINARTYSSGYVGGVTGGGMIVSGGGYAGDYGYGVGGGYVHVDDRPVVVAPPSAPFGYAVYGFGRDYPVGGPWIRRDDRYGGEGRWREERRYDERSDHYERWEHSEEYRSEVEARWEYEIIGRESRAYDRGYDDGRADCDCRRPEPRHEAPPHHEAEVPPEYRYEPGPGTAYYGDLPPPDAPRMAPPPRHDYRQEPGERG